MGKLIISVKLIGVAFFQGSLFFQVSSFKFRSLDNLKFLCLKNVHFLLHANYFALILLPFLVKIGQIVLEIVSLILWN